MTLMSPPSHESRIVLRDISWRTYTSLVKELESQHLRLTYDQGTLEIMSPSPQHGRIGKFIARLVEMLTLELDIPIVGLGNTTWTSTAAGKGLEADECYYIRHAIWAAQREQFDLDVDPAPDLAIEVDVTSSSLNKQGIYEQLKVAELWRWDAEAERLHVLVLGADGHYQESERSAALPMLPIAVVERFVRRRTEGDDTRLLREFRDWIAQALKQ